MNTLPKRAPASAMLGVLAREPSHAGTLFLHPHVRQQEAAECSDKSPHIVAIGRFGFEVDQL